MTALPQTPGRKLKLFQANDPLKEWWSLSETRFCRKCGHLFTGSDIRVSEDKEGKLHFHCPTFKCPGQWEDWEYPQLHL